MPDPCPPYRPAEAWPGACRRALRSQELLPHAPLQPRPEVPLWGQTPRWWRPQQLAWLRNSCPSRSKATRADSQPPLAHTRPRTISEGHPCGGQPAGAVSGPRSLLLARTCSASPLGPPCQGGWRHTPALARPAGRGSQTGYPGAGAGGAVRWWGQGEEPGLPAAVAPWAPAPQQSPRPAPPTWLAAFRATPGRQGCPEHQ